MEKVIVAQGFEELRNYDLKEVNEYLERGWTVKSVTMHHMRHSEGFNAVNAVFVLENKKET